MPGFDGDLEDGEEDAEGGKESFRALPVLFMALHAAFELRDAAAVAVAHKAGDLCLEYGEVAEDLGFEFVHHAHREDSNRDQKKAKAGPSLRLKNGFAQDDTFIFCAADCRG
jgi:hypothetical protein